MEYGGRSILSSVFDTIFNMANTRSDINQLVRELTMEAAGEIPPNDTRQDLNFISNCPDSS